MPLPPVTHTVFDGSPLTAFESTVREVLNKTAIKTRELDLLPLLLLAELVDDLPSFTSVINDSLLTGSFPCVFKSAVVRLLLKKTSLDATNLKNYWPVANLPFLSEITEKIALLQLSQHLESNNLFRPGHSTETALLKFVNNLLAALDVDHISLLSLLDLSAAFDTIDKSILLSRLHHVFGISGRFSRTDQTWVVSVSGASSAPAALNFSVPQGSVFGPIFFVLYTHPIAEIVSYHSFTSQFL